MTMHNTLHTGSTAHLVLAAVDARLGLAGFLAKGGPGPVDVRLGVMWPSGGFSVAGTSSTSPWQYSVPGASFVTSKGSLDGPHVGSNDATYLVSTIAPPASNSRYDVIYVMQQDADATISPDASTAPLISVYNGPASATPSRSAALAAIPVGALALADALVLSTATGGTSGTGVTITQDFLWTATRGAPIPVRNATEKAAISWGTATEPAFVYEIDTGTTEINTGSGWSVYLPKAPRGIWTLASATAVTSGAFTVAPIATAVGTPDASMSNSGGAITLSVAGQYEVEVAAVCNGTGGNTRAVIATLNCASINGSGVLSGGSVVGACSQSPTGTYPDYTITTTLKFDANANDVLRIFLFHDNGSSITLNVGGPTNFHGSTELIVRRIG